MKATLALLGYALGAIWRRRSRSLATAGGLLAGVALLSAVLFLTDALKAEAHRAQRAMPDLVIQQMVGGRPALIDPELAAAIRPIPAVASVQPRVWGYLFLPAIQGNITVIAVPPSAFENASPPLPLEVGKDLNNEDRRVLLGFDLANELGVRPGDLLRFPAFQDRAKPFRVAGILPKISSLHTSDVVMAKENEVREILGLPPNLATDLAVTLTTPDESSIVARQVVDLKPQLRIVDRKLLDRIYALSFGRRSGVLLAGALPVLLAFLVIAWDRISGLGTAERREIAILKACGWSTSNVLTVRLYEATLLAVFSATIGIVLGYLWVFVLGAPGLRSVLAGWSVLLPTAALTPQVDSAQVLAILATMVGPFVAVSIVPAWRAAILDPAEVLRGG